MTEIFLAAAMIVSLIILYKYLPNRKIFIYFCMSLVMVFAIAGFLTRSQQPQQTMNQTQRLEIMNRQKIFIDWYTEYQKDIEQLDRNWQSFHNIIENFKSDETNDETIFERLSNLESEVRIEQVHIYTLKVPSGIGEECSALTEEILKKTRQYADAQAQTISLCKSLTETEKFLNSSRQEQIHQFQDIIIREAPAGLFTANEISEILRYFKLSAIKSDEFL